MSTQTIIQSIIGIDTNKLQRIYRQLKRRRQEDETALLIFLIIIFILSILVFILPPLVFWRYNKDPKSVVTYFLIFLTIIYFILAARIPQPVGIIYSGAPLAYIGAKQFKLIK